MWPLCGARTPRRTRPPLASASSQATEAVTMGLRGKATAMPVRMSMSAATASAPQVRYAVRPASVTTRPESPAAAARRPRSPARRSGWAPSMTSNFSIGSLGSCGGRRGQPVAPGRHPVVDAGEEVVRVVDRAGGGVVVHHGGADAAGLVVGRAVREVAVEDEEVAGLHEHGLGGRGVVVDDLVVAVVGTRAAVRHVR